MDQGAVEPSNIVLDANRVYWGSGQGVIVSVLKTGGGQLILANGRASVAVDDNYVYSFSLLRSSSKAVVNRVSKAGGAPELVVATGRYISELGSLAVDARSLYWVEQPEGPPGSLSRVYKLVKLDL